MHSVQETIAQELAVQEAQVAAAIKLLDQGDTVPFISRYRKEVTGGLTDTQLRELEERLRYLRELNERKETVLNSIREQEKLTPELEQAILEADSKARLEDLYRPFKPKRRTRGQIAIEAGLAPLAEQLLGDPTLVPEDVAKAYLNEEKDIKDVQAALTGARYILMERFAEAPDLVGRLRDKMWAEGIVKSQVVEGKEKEGQKFSDYFDFHESIQKIPSHRALAILRGRNEGFLQVSIELEESLEPMIADYFQIQHQSRAADDWLKEVVHWTWQVKLRVQLEVELLTNMREQADEKAIEVFAANLRDVLMASPAGHKVILGLDPGLRTGVKCAVVDETGQLLHHTTIFPHPPQKQWDQSLLAVGNICKQFKVSLISIGNGTASRETEKFVGEMCKKFHDMDLVKTVVSEAGASVYSASALAAKEFPDLDVSFRGAVSIARRLQDPLAELVKIEPKSIGVGQYQHDVNQSKLARMLDAVVEDCVNAVGVELNSASTQLLTRVAGLNPTLAGNIVAYRNQFGCFKNREELKKVSRMGPKAFEQAAGFLRISNGDNPLDKSGVHPESYGLVEKILAKYNVNINDLIGNKNLLASIDAKAFVTDGIGEPTIVDMLSELEKPGRDPRPEFKTAQFKAGVETLKDLETGMILEGVVTNVAHFGAFVDVGVHQDGLVHISAMTHRFIKDPREVVKAGDIVKVKVTEVDLARKRISLSMKLDAPAESASQSKRADNQQRPAHTSKQTQKKPMKKSKPKAKDLSAFGSALAAALRQPEPVD